MNSCFLFAVFAITQLQASPAALSRQRAADCFGPIKVRFYILIRLHLTLASKKCNAV